MELNENPIVKANTEPREANSTEVQTQNRQEPEQAKEDKIVKAMVIAVVRSPSGEENLRLFPATNTPAMTRLEAIKAMNALRDTLVSQEAVDVFVQEAISRVFPPTVTSTSSAPAT